MATFHDATKTKMQTMLVDTRRIPCNCNTEQKTACPRHILFGCGELGKWIAQEARRTGRTVEQVQHGLRPSRSYNYRTNN